MTETNYGVVRERMQRDYADADSSRGQAAASSGDVEQRRQAAAEAVTWAGTTAEEMQALKVDGKTLSKMEEHLSAVDAAKKAEDELSEALGGVQGTWTRTMGTAEKVSGQLVGSGHATVQQARDSAAGGGAERPFYQPG